MGIFCDSEFIGVVFVELVIRQLTFFKWSDLMPNDLRSLVWFNLSYSARIYSVKSIKYFFDFNASVHLTTSSTYLRARELSRSWAWRC